MLSVDRCTPESIGPYIPIALLSLELDHVEHTQSRAISQIIITKVKSIDAIVLLKPFHEVMHILVVIEVANIEAHPLQTGVLADSASQAFPYRGSEFLMEQMKLKKTCVIGELLGYPFIKRIVLPGLLTEHFAGIGFFLETLVDLMRDTVFEELILRGTSCAVCFHLRSDMLGLIPHSPSAVLTPHFDGGENVDILEDVAGSEQVSRLDGVYLQLHFLSLE